MPLVRLAVVAIMVGARVAHAARVAAGDAETHFGAEQDSSEADARAGGEFRPGLPFAAFAATAAGRHGYGAPRNDFVGTPEGTSANANLMHSVPLRVRSWYPTALGAAPSVAATDDALQPPPLKGGLLFLGARYDRVDYKLGDFVNLRRPDGTDISLFNSFLEKAFYDIKYFASKAKPKLFVLEGSRSSEGQSVEKLFDQGNVLFEVVNDPQIQKKVADLWADNWKDGVTLLNGEATRVSRLLRFARRLPRVFGFTPPMPYTVVCLKELPLYEPYTGELGYEPFPEKWFPAGSHDAEAGNDTK